MMKLINVDGRFCNYKTVFFRAQTSTGNGTARASIGLPVGS